MGGTMRSVGGTGINIVWGGGTFNEIIVLSTN